MKIVLTGGTGFIGSAVLGQLLAAGHEVTALVRGDAAAARVTAHGAQAETGDFYDTGWVADRLAGADGVIHTAAASDGTSEALDRSVVAGAVQAIGGTGVPYVHTSGIWVYGDSATVTEESPFAPPAITAWRTGVERLVLDSDLNATIVTPGIVFGNGTGIPAAAFGARDDAGRVLVIGDGTQHWTTIHVDDVASLYRVVVERGERLGYVIAVSGDNPTVRELAEAASRGAGATPEPAEATHARLGVPFTEALLLDQQATGAKARSLGWLPKGPALAEDLRSGSYTG